MVVLPKSQEVGMLVAIVSEFGRAMAVLKSDLHI